MSGYILGIDQSTAGTKALLFSGQGDILDRCDFPHRQKISDNGWISHDPMEIYGNVLSSVRQLLNATGIDTRKIAAIGISNQRETAMVWDRETGQPIHDAVVWQCGRAADICATLQPHAAEIQARTGLPLSPYFSAAKIAWILDHAGQNSGRDLCAGTMDSWLVFKLTGQFRTDYSNASRTQLFNLHTLSWDPALCALFGIPQTLLPELTDSNGNFGSTDLEGLLAAPVPIRGVLGDSHGALFGQGCLLPGMAKATYGTGSSVMMHVGTQPIFSKSGLVTSLAWRMDGKADFVLEGNINYTGAVTKWLAEDLQLLSSPGEAGVVAGQANPHDTTYLVPAFTGLGAPHWNSGVRAMFCGMGRGTGRAELVRAAEESIAYQIADVATAMEEDTGMAIRELRVDGGPTHDQFLMQFQSDILNTALSIPKSEELSAIGAAYAAGISAGLYDRALLSRLGRRFYRPQMDDSTRMQKYGGWQQAVSLLLHHSA